MANAPKADAILRARRTSPQPSSYAEVAERASAALGSSVSTEWAAAVCVRAGEPLIGGGDDDVDVSAVPADVAAALSSTHSHPASQSSDSGERDALDALAECRSPENHRSAYAQMLKDEEFLESTLDGFEGCPYSSPLFGGDAPRGGLEETFWERDLLNDGDEVAASVYRAMFPHDPISFPASGDESKLGDTPWHRWCESATTRYYQMLLGDGGDDLFGDGDGDLFGDGDGDVLTEEFDNTGKRVLGALIERVCALGNGSNEQMSRDLRDAADQVERLRDRLFGVSPSGDDPDWAPPTRTRDIKNRMFDALDALTNPEEFALPHSFYKAARSAFSEALQDITSGLDDMNDCLRSSWSLVSGVKWLLNEFPMSSPVRDNLVGRTILKLRKNFKQLEALVEDR